MPIPSAASTIDEQIYALTILMQEMHLIAASMHGSAIRAVVLITDCSSYLLLCYLRWHTAPFHRQLHALGIPGKFAASGLFNQC